MNDMITMKINIDDDADNDMVQLYIFYAGHCRPLK